MRSLLILFACASVAMAQAPTHDITPDDYFTLPYISEIAVSPDGKHVAYSELRWDLAEDNRKADLWVVPTNGKGKPRRLTFDRANERHIRWAADGSGIYVLANRKRAAETAAPYDGKTQVWRIPATGGEPRAVTRVPGGIVSFDYAPKADAIYYTVDAKATENDDFAKLRAKYSKVEYGHGVRTVSELHKLDLTTWTSEKLIAEERYIRDFAVTKNGEKIAMVTAFDDTVVKSEGESRVDVWQAGKVVTPPTDAYRAKASSPYAWLENLTWSPEGTRFAFTAVHDAYPAEVIIGTANGDKWDVSRYDREKKWEVVGYGRAIGAPVQFFNETDFVVIIEQLGNLVAQTAHVSKGTTGAHVTIGSIHAFDPSGVYLVASPTAFQTIEIWGKKASRLVDTGAHTKNWKLPRVEHITWKAPDGTEVGGVLELPHGYKKGDKLPLVVAIHGGPTTATRNELAFDPHNGRMYFTAKGYATLLPNYRGSTGYGDKFVTDLVGRENDVEVKEILAGIQHLVKEGIADSDRVGVMGWSNGGYLTNCLITLEKPPVKIRAASSGAGILDTVAEWGFNDEPAYPIVFKKGLPWEQPDIYKKTSPTYGIHNVTTPTIVHVGGNDVRCPPGHSQMLYRALKEYKKVPTELIVYTGEPHGLTKPSNRKAKMEWDLAWFGKYMK